MKSTQAEQIATLISTASAVAEETESVFGKLTAEQLNWKPSAAEWSVAQCFEHLVTGNESYYPIFERVRNGEEGNSFWKRLPWVPAFWGKMLLKAVLPESSRKLKAPKKFRPAKSSIDTTIVRRFKEQQGILSKYMRDTEDLDLERIIITSPVTNLIVYSLMDAYRIIIAHEKRHLLQARRVSKTDGFPD